MDDLIQITEGTTKLLVPRESMSSDVPPKEPAFFNPRAKFNRDLSMIAYGAFVDNFEGPKILLDGMSGIGARSIRAANEISNIETVVLNDVNPSALRIAMKSAEINTVNCKISENETCRFLSEFAKRDNRGSIIDLDPFGSPARYLDCALRATMHGGMLAITATDLQVLNGLFQNACLRRYGGIAVRTEYGNEVAIRLMLGCLNHIANRMDITIQPLFVESDMHYYRAYTRILNKPNQDDSEGIIIHCENCGHRTISDQKENCKLCNSNTKHAGPLWIGKLFDKQFVQHMIKYLPKLNLDDKYQRILDVCVNEADMPVSYYTLDDIAKRMQCSPPKLQTAITQIKEAGFMASKTSLNPTGFHTNANIKDVKKILSHDV